MKMQFNMASTIRFAMATAVIFLGIGVVRADVLELRTGEVIQGKFLGGSPLNIRFEVQGQERVFATKDVLNIGFTDTTVSSSAAPAIAPPAPATTTAPPAAPSAPSSLTAIASSSSSSSSSTPQTTQAITIPSGTDIIIRMIDTVDSSTNKVGDTFHASLESPLTVGDTVVAPKGANVYGKLAQAKDSGKISGASQLTLELTGIQINGKTVSIDSSDYDVAGKSRGKQSAERIGGGAVLGAIIGGIAGGGKGAAVGAGVGAGAGTAVQVLTHGDHIRVPSETMLDFTLQNSVAVPVAGSN